MSELRNDAQPGHMICPGCARAFRCGHGTPGCWCAAIVLRPETLAELRALAADCLCSACLGQLARSDRVGAARLHPHLGAGVEG